MSGGRFSVYEIKETLTGHCGEITNEVSLPEAMIFAT